MKEYRQKKEDGSIDVRWPKDIIFDAMMASKELRIEVTATEYSDNISGVFTGMVNELKTNSFDLEVGRTSRGIAGEIEVLHYANVLSVEVLHSKESESPRPEELSEGIGKEWNDRYGNGIGLKSFRISGESEEPTETLREGIWRVMSDGIDDGYAVIQEVTDTGWRTKGPMLTRDQAEWLIVSHNEVIKKLNEHTIRQACEDSDMPMKMTPEGIAFSMPDISFPNAFIARQFAQRIMQEVNALRVGDIITILHNDDSWVDGGEGGFSKSMTEAISDGIVQGGDVQREAMRKGDDHEE